MLDKFSSGACCGPKEPRWHNIFSVPGVTKIIMKEKTGMPAETGFAIFLLGIEQKYHVPLEEVLEAVSKFGFSKGKIQGYFEVQSYLKNKGLPPQNVNAAMVHKWFPA
jgi:hypothetical protein